MKSKKHKKKTTRKPKKGAKLFWPRTKPTKTATATNIRAFSATLKRINNRAKEKITKQQNMARNNSQEKKKKKKKEKPPTNGRIYHREQVKEAKEGKEREEKHEIAQNKERNKGQGSINAAFYILQQYKETYKSLRTHLKQWRPSTLQAYSSSSDL